MEIFTLSALHYCDIVSRTVFQQPQALPASWLFNLSDIQLKSLSLIAFFLLFDIDKKNAVESNEAQEIGPGNPREAKYYQDQEGRAQLDRVEEAGRYSCDETCSMDCQQESQNGERASRRHTVRMRVRLIEEEKHQVEDQVTFLTWHMLMRLYGKRLWEYPRKGANAHRISRQQKQCFWPLQISHLGEKIHRLSLGPAENEFLYAQFEHDSRMKKVGLRKRPIVVISANFFIQISY